jgi:hypothetical protein
MFPQRKKLEGAVVEARRAQYQGGCTKLEAVQCRQEHDSEGEIAHMSAKHRVVGRVAVKRERGPLPEQ